MKPSALLVNVARAASSTKPRNSADDGRIAGAALDVFLVGAGQGRQQSPPHDHPYRLPLSPHNAWATGVAIDTLVRCVARNIDTLKKK